MSSPFHAELPSIARLGRVDAQRSRLLSAYAPANDQGDGLCDAFDYSIEIVAGDLAIGSNDLSVRGNATMGEAAGMSATAKSLSPTAIDVRLGDMRTSS